MENGKRIVIYARCSTTKDQKPEVQMEELKRYCQARGGQVTHEIIDTGFSGTTDKRPGLQQLNKLVRSRQVDVVLVLKLDRLFRSLKHLVTTLQEYSELGIEFISVKDQIDMTTASGRLMVHILAAFAEFEAALIRERTILGLEYARSKGKILGRPQKHDFLAIIKLRQQGLSYRQIEKQLGCPMAVITRAVQSALKSLKESDQNVKVKTNG